MTKKSLFVLLFVLGAILAFYACGDDSSDDTSGATGTFKATVIDFPGRKAVEGVKVTLLDNKTGDPIQGMEPQVSSATGAITFENVQLPEDGLVAFLCQKAADSDGKNAVTDTYQFNIDGKAQDESLWAVPTYIYNTAPAAAGISLQEGTTVAAGAVYWVNKEGKEEIVGCAKVESDPKGADVRYMGKNNMPTTLENQDGTNPLNGFFIMGNMQPGVGKTKAFIDGKEIGATSMVAKPDSICIGNIYATTDSNPKTCSIE